MEVFSVFATLSLKDLLSGPLARIRQGVGNLETGIASLGSRMGNLALAMAPVAIGAGAVLGAFGKCVATAAGFEDQMAKVAAISRSSASELEALESRARELGATTQFTASQVAQAEQYLAMAGFTVQENLDALPGVLNLAAATATDLGRAADISSDIMGAFGLKASEMTRVADTLALTCAQANTDMEKLGDTMKYCAPVAKKAGLSLEETAAMAGLLGDVGIKGSQAGTTLKAMLNKLAAPTSEATTLLKKLGVTTRDAAGNLRSPIQVLGELTAKMKGMGSADQIAAMKKIVGEEAMAGFSELLNQADGAGKLMGKIEKLIRGEGTAADMAARQNDSLAGDLRGLGSAFESVQITVGKIFIPVLRKGVSVVTSVIRAIDKFSQTRAGKTILKIAAALATALVAITAFSAGMWAFTKVAPMISGVFGTIRAAMLGLGAPVWAIIAAIGALCAIWKNDFGGIATVVSGWWKKIRLVFQGVCAVFNTLKGTSGELRGELAREIKANGLVGVVTTVGKIVFRIREFFAGIWQGLNFDRIVAAFKPAVLKIRQLFDLVGNAIARVFGGEVGSAASSARSLGEVIGKVLTFALEGLATAITVVVNAIDAVVSFFRMLCAIFTGDFSAAAEMAGNIWQDFCDSLMAIADWLGIGDWIRDAWKSVTDFFANLDLAGSLKAAWDAVLSFLASLNPVPLIRKAWAGITDFFSNLNLAGGVKKAWSKVKAFLSAINPLNLVRAAWAKVTGWLGSLNLAAGIKNAWGKVKSFLAAMNPLNWIKAAWNRVASFLGAFKPLEKIRKGWEVIKQFLSRLNPLEWIRKAWEHVTAFFGSLNLMDGLRSAWDKVASFLSALNPVTLFRRAWAAVSDFFGSLNLGEKIRGAWDSVTGFLSSINPIALISDAFSGLSGFFSQLDFAGGIRQAWNAVVEFFSGLNLFESGAKLINTLKEGVLSAASALIDGVKGVFSKIRSYLPFSDAKEGPLSELTYSGQAMMTTLGEGVNLGKGSLTEAVSGALGEVNGELQDFQESMNPLENLAQEPWQMAAPGMPDAMGLPLTPDLDAAQIAGLPNPAPLNGVYGKTPDLPPANGILNEGALRIVSPELPDLPLLEMQAMPAQTEAIPGVSPPEIARVFPVPEPEAPRVAIPDAPFSQGQPAEGAQTQSAAAPSQQINITIGEISLPDVQDTESFVASLKSALQGEIGQFEGAAS